MWFLVLYTVIFSILYHYSTSVLYVQPKADYIRKEDILTELQKIEDDLFEWEKRGVELEVKLRTCEQGGTITSHKTVYHREAHTRAALNYKLCVFVCQRATTSLSWMSSWSSGST